MLCWATAVRDGAIPANPANIPGAGTDRAKERPVASVAQVAALIEAITPRYRAAVLLGAWCGLRRGEIIALRPEDIDLDAGTVTVRTNRVELLETRQAFDAPPKTDAGKRTIAVPPHVLPILEAHMGEWSGTDRVFVGRDGKPMRGDAVRQAFARARRKAICQVSGSTIFATQGRPWPRRLVPRQGSNEAAWPRLARRR